MGASTSTKMGASTSTTTDLRKGLIVSTPIEGEHHLTTIDDEKTLVAHYTPEKNYSATIRQGHSTALIQPYVRSVIELSLSERVENTFTFVTNFRDLLDARGIAVRLALRQMHVRHADGLESFQVHRMVNRHGNTFHLLWAEGHTGDLELWDDSGDLSLPVVPGFTDGDEYTIKLVVSDKQRRPPRIHADILVDADASPKGCIRRRSLRPHFGRVFDRFFTGPLAFVVVEFSHDYCLEDNDADIILSEMSSGKFETVIRIPAYISIRDYARECGGRGGGQRVVQRGLIALDWHSVHRFGNGPSTGEVDIGGALHRTSSSVISVSLSQDDDKAIVRCMWCTWSVC